MKKMTKSNSDASGSLFSSKLFDENRFYDCFLKDLNNAKEEVIIESPFISTKRMKLLVPIFKKLAKRKIKVYIITRRPEEHVEEYRWQSEKAIRMFEVMGIQPLLCVGNHHRKLAIIDREILWEGSLNILSQIKSREIMRRIEGEHFALEMFDFLKLEKFL